MSADVNPAETGARVAPAPVEFRYTQTDSFVGLLQQLGASLLVSTYQANKLLAVGAAGPGLSMLVRAFDRPMGLAANGGTGREATGRSKPPREGNRSASHVIRRS